MQCLQAVPTKLLPVYDLVAPFVVSKHPLRFGRHAHVSRHAKHLYPGESQQSKVGSWAQQRVQCSRERSCVRDYVIMCLIKLYVCRVCRNQGVTRYTSMGVKCSVGGKNVEFRGDMLSLRVSSRKGYRAIVEGRTCRNGQK
jgi:hypothetical protein